MAPLPDSHPKRLFDARPNLDPPARAPPTLHQPDDPPSLPSHAPHPPRKRERAAAPNGNFRGYYARRRVTAAHDAPDERLALVPDEWVRGKRVLDVGCNAGAVTVELAQRMRAHRVTGVDIDGDLVKAARRHVEQTWSRQAPLQRLVDEATFVEKRQRSRSPPPPLPPLQLDEATSPFLPSTPFYFPSSLARMFGPLPAPKHLLTTYHDPPETETHGVVRKGKRKAVPKEVRAFPENIRIVQADWVNSEIESDREGYDVIVAFSVTKWIHLQSLNVGLLTFFRRCFDSLLPGGKLLLEPQPFSTYARSVRTAPQELQDNYARLVEGADKGWRAEDGDFERVLLELVGFEKRELLGESGRKGTSFRRPVEVYTKRAGAGSRAV
ncbi:hypothetical protein Rhopal_006315-T1 [Rhodotorula paludigena]|uniref:RNA methyltransferase n=1 Tax=Rhodotorula paludigena TaxID=86838 RepID=A0AAV5GSQ0_9BASI|nr:hypothetical protein Rhopal_006315-T1 [Rhodotorula paludigena]